MGDSPLLGPDGGVPGKTLGFCITTAMTRPRSFSGRLYARWATVVAGEDMTLTSELTTRHPIQVVCKGQRAELASGEVRSFRRAN